MKSIITKFVLMTIGFLCVNASQAGGIEQFKAFIKSTESAKGEFIQRQVRIENGQQKVSNQFGKFSFARPGKFIWLYQKPYEQLLQADGENLYLYDKDLNQVTVKKLGTALSSSPAAILFGSNDLEKNFVLKNLEKKSDMEFFEATPKGNDSAFSLISIGMQNGVPREMELLDNFKKSTTIVLQNIEKNPANLKKGDPFKFTVPAGADVFDVDNKTE